MNEENFQRIEQALGIQLPDWYRRQLLEYPLPEPDESLYGDEASILRENQELRQNGWFDFPWPSEFFVIGSTGCGDDYFILPATKDRRVFLADHEGGPAPLLEHLDEMATAESLEQHIEQTLGTMREHQAWLERHRNKKWWQFWI